MVVNHLKNLKPVGFAVSWRPTLFPDRNQVWYVAVPKKKRSQNRAYPIWVLLRTFSLSHPQNSLKVPEFFIGHGKHHKNMPAFNPSRAIRSTRWDGVSHRESSESAAPRVLGRREMASQLATPSHCLSYLHVYVYIYIYIHIYIGTYICIYIYICIYSI